MELEYVDEFVYYKNGIEMMGPVRRPLFKCFKLPFYFYFKISQSITGSERAPREGAIALLHCASQGGCSEGKE